MKYFALLTKLGENLLAQATALGTKIELTHMAIGDGGGVLPTPDTKQTKLINEKRRAAINTLFIDDKNKNQIIAEQIIPEIEGGYWIREIGLYDKAGNLIAVANCPETYKPQLSEGSGRTQTIRMILVVSYTETVTLKIDPAVVLATRDYVDGLIQVQDKKLTDLSTKTQADLNKKIDKASITQQLGNSREAVPSQDLVTVQLGKKQDKGDFATKIELKTGLDGKLNTSTIKQTTGTSITDIMSQKIVTDELDKKQNSGDFATNAALKDGLDKKFDKTGGVITGDVVASGTIAAGSSGDYTGVILKRGSTGSVRLETNAVGSKASLSIINRNADNTTIAVVGVPNKSGTLMQVGDFGVGTRALVLTTAELIASRETQFFKQGGGFVDDAFGGWGVGQLIGYDASRNFGVFMKGDGRISNYMVNGGNIINYDIYNTANTTIDRNGHLKASGSTELSDYPPGAPIPWPQATAPSGFLICNGQSFNKTTYPLLTKAYPSGILPDLRGEFIRGLDAGRNIDGGRDVLSVQADEFKAHTHTVGGIYGGDSIGGKQRVQSDGTAQASSSNGGNETRPRNVAFLYIVRAA